VGLVLLYTMMLACAEIGPPPGGEVDRIGPVLLESDPPDGAMGVSPRQHIALTFSERLVKPEMGAGVFISPRPAHEPQIKWKSNRILIDLGEPFQPDQTYVVSVSSDVADLRRNRLDSAVIIAFSTGQHIDSGTVEGRILTREGKPAAAWAVGLYQQLDFPDTDAGDSVYPAYLTIANQQGHFSLRYLPDGSCRLFAFDDKNRDELFNPEVERFAVPDRAIVVGGELELDQLVMAVTKFDSLFPRVISVVGTSNGLVRARLSRVIDPSRLARYPEDMVLQAHDGTGVSYSAQAILEADQEETSVLTACFQDLPDDTYRLTMIYAADRTPLVHDSVFFKRTTDKTVPTLIDMQPGGGSLFVNQVVLRLTFSEPIDTTRLSDQTFVLWESDSLLIPTTRIWQDCFRLTLGPEQIRPGRQYRLDITEFDVADLSSNLLGDSLRSFRFSTHDSDSLGSISGELIIELASRKSDPAVLSFRNTSSNKEFNLTLGPSSSSNGEGKRLFAIDVPPGKYILSAFLDSDQDGKHTPGGIRPFRLAETKAYHPDTIGVRARFETAGVEFKIE